MALLEDLIQTRLSAPAIVSHLTTFNGAPAVWHDQPPADTDLGWADGPKYPRILWSLRLSNDWQSQIKGRLSIDTWTSQALTDPETLRNAIKAQLHATVLSPDAPDPICAFALQDVTPWVPDPNVGDDLLYGETLTFTVIGCPTQTSTAPDPVAGMSAWTSTFLPNLSVNPAFWAPSDSSPAIYWRLLEEDVDEEWGGITWYRARLSASIFAPDQTSRLPLVHQLVQAIGASRQTSLASGAYLYFEGRPASYPGADPFGQTGHLLLEVTYGVDVPAPAGTGSAIGGVQFTLTDPNNIVLSPTVTTGTGVTINLPVPITPTQGTNNTGADGGTDNLPWQIPPPPYQPL